VGEEKSFRGKENNGLKVPEPEKGFKGFQK
jgi:hypothetical protein